MRTTIGEYSVDNVKYFDDHEGMSIFKCDILYCHEKIGTFSEDYYNAPAEMHFYNDFDEELNKIRKTAKEFFKKYSKENKLIANEDFFIRFLTSLNFAEQEANTNQKITISTSYPYEYEINHNEELLAPIILENKEENKLEIPILPFTINIDVLYKENKYELD